MILQMITDGKALDLPDLIITLIFFVISGMLAFTAHDFAQLLTARFCGAAVKVTANPFRQLKNGSSWVSCGVLLLFGAGCKARAVIPEQKRLQSLLTSLSGPVFCAAVGFIGILAQAVLLHFTADTALEGWVRYLYTFISTFYISCITTAIFSFMPVPPFDGGHIVAALLPQNLREKFLSLGMYTYAAAVVLTAILARSGAIEKLWTALNYIAIDIAV